MKLSDLRPTPGSKKKPKRVGRGNASGHGTSATRGGKGQTARSGYRIPPGFEGGQTPLWKRVPKRGFKNTLRKSYSYINIGRLNERFSDGAEVTPQTLAEHGLIGIAEAVKVLGDGPLSKKLVVHAHRFSKSARAKILAAGGQVIALEPPTEKEAEPAKKPQKKAAADTPKATAAPVQEPAKHKEKSQAKIEKPEKKTKTEK